MNKRIRELAGKAGFQSHRDGHIYTSKLEHLPITDTIEKFAELIVRECVKVVDETMTENQEMNIGLVMASAQIVAHFGVEE